MTADAQTATAENQRSGNYLRRLVIIGITGAWAIFWSLVALEIYASREALQSGLQETSVAGAIVTMFLIFIFPALYIIFTQLSRGKTRVG